MKRSLFRKALLFFTTFALFFYMGVASIESTTFAQGRSDHSFSDVKSTAWYYNAVSKMARKGILAGYDDGTFRPMENISRGAFATLMVKTLDLSIEKPDSPWFADVPKKHWAYKYVETSKYYMTGYSSDGKYYFKPDENAVREDMAVALVKALDYDLSSNLDSLDDFEDEDKISSNLRPYVATAVEKGLMSGSEDGGKLYFNPNSDLSRAETAALLSNLIDDGDEDEKIVIDDNVEKVTFDDLDEPEKSTDAENDEDNDDAIDEYISDIDVEVDDGVLVIEWDKTKKSGFQGYKVVASQSDSTPKYPDNGYYKFITDRDKNKTEIKPYASYKNGDFSVFEPGQTYYFSITTLYDDNNYAGNVVSVTMPGEVIEYDEYIIPEVEAYIENGKIVINWDKISHPLFQGYKVVASISDSTPVYPENGYAAWITNADKTSYKLHKNAEYKNGDFNKFQSGQTYYISVTAVYSDKKISGNIVTITLP